ncbi:extracellular solute-binding protein family 1 [Firmicutes bacterium CAG:449]|nr:extracellular solute-binding protein family 1 [Firmicutes bacterium CAG:449]
MKKSLLLVSLGLLLVGCGETNNSSIEEKNTLNELLTSLSNKFHTTYQNSEGTFSYYQQPNYTFDTYTNVGLIVMNNGGCYEYTLYEDNIICSLPSLNDKSYFETYRQTINLSLDDFSLVDNKYVSSDEKMEPNGGILVREDWYKEACAHIDGDMTSPESFIAGCNYIKSKYSNSIPVQLDVFDSEGNDSVKWLSQYFATPFEDEQGNYVYNMTHEKYYETLSFLNECYNNKLIMDENFSMNASQIRTKIASGNVFVSMVTPQDYQQGFIASYNSDIKYVPLILRNYEGDDPILQDIRGMGYLYTMVTTNAKRPDKIIKLLDFLYSEEGQRLVAFGLEGETWNWVDDKHTEIKWTDTYLNSVNNDDTGKYGLYQMTLMMNLAYINKIKPLNGRKDVDIYIDNLKKPISPYSYDYTASFLKDDTSDKSYNEVSVNETKGVQRWSSSYLAKVLRSSNKEQARQYYDQGISYMKKNCMLEKVIEFNSQSYKRAKEALKLTYAWPKNMENYVSPKTGPNGDFSYWKGATHE